MSQVREAYLTAAKTGTVKTVLHRLFAHALKVGKRVRAETALNRNAMSVSHAAVKLSRRLAGGLEGKTVMVLGAGEMARLALERFIDDGVCKAIIANRTLCRAESLSTHVGGSPEVETVPILLEHVPSWLTEVDVLLSAVDVTERLLSRESVSEIMRSRQDKPLYIIDIAVPRSVDPDVSTVKGVTLFTIEEIQYMVDYTGRERERESAKAERIVVEETGKFQEWMRSLKVAPVARMLKEGADRIVRDELRWAFNKLPVTAVRERRIIQAVIHRVVNKLLHGPFMALKRFGEKGELETEIEECLRQLSNDLASDEEVTADRKGPYPVAPLNDEMCDDDSVEPTRNPGYYPAFIDLRGRPCLVVGGGSVAARKVFSLLRSGAEVTVISPEINSVLEIEVELGMIRWIPREYTRGDAKGFFLVIAASSNDSVNRAVADDVGDGLINVVDSPNRSTFIVPSVVNRGGLVIAVSTSGKSPALASRIRRELEMSYPEAFAGLIDYLAEIRRLLKQKIPDFNTRREILRKIVDLDLPGLVRSGGHGTARRLIDGVLREYGLETSILTGKEES